MAQYTTYDFAGKVALITGGVSGIGLATAIGFAKGGAKVVIAGRTRERGERAAEEIASYGLGAHFVQADVSRPDDVALMVAETVRQYGRLDYALNNVGLEFIDGKKSLIDTEQDEFGQFVNTNIGGVFNGMKRQIPAMLETAGGGAIVNITTAAGLRPIREVGNIYAATRYALVGLTANAARDWAPKGIRINAVLPGSVLSRPHAPRSPELLAHLISRHPIGRLGESDEIANAVLWLCSDNASFVVGTMLKVDGGLDLS